MTLTSSIPSIPYGSRVVPGFGPRDAKIVIVGEAPGVTEELKLQPFVGGSGNLLTQMLNAAGIDRNQCYLTNVVKVRPPANNFGVYYEDVRRLQPTPFLNQSIQNLIQEIKQIRPNVIVACGAEALRALTGRALSITNWRGSLLSSEAGKVLPTLHPAFVLRQYRSRPIVELDLQRAARESLTPDYVRPKFEFLLDPSFDVVVSQLKRRDFSRFAFDIETIGPRVRCLGLSFNEHSAISIPFISIPSQRSALAAAKNPLVGGSIIKLGGASVELSSHWTTEQEYEILSLLWDLFSDPSIEKIAQNFPFDSVILAKEFGLTHIPNFYMDTMGAQHTCYCELPKGLDFLVSIYTDINYYSNYSAANDYQTWEYNCYDCVGTLQSSYKLDQELKDLGVDEFYFNHVHPVIGACTRAESRGIKIDVATRATETFAKREEKEKLLVDLRTSVGIPNFNPKSPKQMKELLYEKLKLPVQLNLKTKKPTADKHAIDKLKQKHEQHFELFTKLESYSKLSTLLSNFLEKPLGADGRIRTHYSPFGTVTGRWSSSEPLFDVGTNLQNIPRGEFRRLFLADAGRYLIKADLSQAEFRIVVWLAKIGRIIQMYEDPTFDVHKWNAGVNIFQIPIEKVSKDQRKVAKDGVYGGNYGMHYKKAALVYKMPVETAQLILTRYLAAVPEIRGWWGEVQNTIKATRRITSPFGRSRIFFDRLDDGFGRANDSLFREAYSHSAQNIVGDIINRAFALGDAMFPEDECHPLLQVHDEIVWSVREDLLGVYLPKVKKLMEYPIKFEGVDKPLIIPVEVSYGRDWYNQTEWKGEEIK